MAAIPKTLAEAGRRSSSQSRKGPLSHGRGGAGNMGNSSNDYTLPTLETPTLKGEVYTTGRGGSGNMAKNTDAEAARRAQDVVGTPRRESSGAQHTGRGGAANVFRPSQDELEGAKRSNSENAVDDDVYIAKEGAKAHQNHAAAHKGLADKSKDWLLGKKN